VLVICYFQRGVLAKGEKLRGAHICFEDILMNISYALSSLATMKDGKPCPAQGRAPQYCGERRLIPLVIAGLDK